MSIKAFHSCFISMTLLFVLAAFAQQQSPENTDSDKAAVRPVFRVGGGVTPPRVLYTQDPEYSEQARAVGYEATSVLWMIIDPDGKPRDIKVARPAGLGLDEKAIEAVRRWKFEPARKDGKPVAVQINVEVAFRLYRNGNTKITKLKERANAGDPNAELELSKVYFEGRELPRNETLAVQFLQRAANAGLLQAQFLMGEHAYAHGGPAADYASAYVWYELSRRGGYKNSEKMLKELAPKMTPEELSAAKARLENWPNTPAK